MLISGNVQDIVNNLKGKPDFLPVSSQGGYQVSLSAGQDSADPNGAANQGTGLTAVNTDHFFPAYPATLGLNVGHLPTQHPLGAYRAGKFGYRLRGTGAGQKPKGDIVQRITGQNGGGLVELPVTGGDSAAKVIIVHARQVVVNQRVRMHHFESRHSVVDGQVLAFGHSPAVLVGGQ